LTDAATALAQAGDDPGASDQEAAAAQLRRQLDEAKKALAEMQRQLEEIAGTNEARRKELAGRQAQMKEMGERRAELTQAVEQQLAELEAKRRQLSERGVDADSSVIKDIVDRELTLKKSALMRQQDEELRQQLDLQARAEAAVEMARRDSMNQSERERRVSELLDQNLLQKLEQSRGELESLRERYTEQSPELLRKRAQVRLLESEMVNAKARLAERNPNEGLAFIAATAIIETGNVISIELRGAKDGRLSIPNLQIEPDGTITLPWVGAVKVSGLTLKQSEETLLKLLASRSVMEEPVKTVNVTIVRRNR
jgi:hypothetical protein